MNVRSRDLRRGLGPKSEASSLRQLKRQQSQMGSFEGLRSDTHFEALLDKRQWSAIRPLGKLQRRVDWLDSDQVVLA